VKNIVVVGEGQGTFILTIITPEMVNYLSVLSRQDIDARSGLTHEP
jgi:hypothetical protein